MCTIADIEFGFNVTVDRKQPLPALISAGHYSFIHPEITQDHFPVQPEGELQVEVVLVHFRKYMRTVEVLTTLGGIGLRPATLPELLAFGKIFPGAQHSLPILALGSVWQPMDSGRLIPGLGGWNERELLLYLFESGGSNGCRFAAVRMH